MIKCRTGSDGAGDTEPELEVESPTIGYRSELREGKQKMNVLNNYFRKCCI